MRRGSLLRSTAVVSSLTGLSRVLGLVREVFMAHYFGTTLAKSAFDVAFRIPNLFRRLFGEGALSAAFIPVFSKSLAEEGRAEARLLGGRALTMLIAFLSVITLVGLLLAQLLLTQAEFIPERGLAPLPLVRIMLPYMVFICAVALCMGMLNSVRHFAVPAATPVLLNLILIVSLWLICPHIEGGPSRRIYVVAWAVLVAGVVQLAVQFPALRREGLLPQLSFDWRDERIRRVLITMAPAAIGMGVLQINVVLDGLLALWVSQEAPAALTYAERLVYLPLGIFATALGTVLLPTYSRQAVRADHAAIADMMTRSLRGILVVMVPASLGLLVLARPIVELVFQLGMFDEDSTLLTSRALAFYAPGLAVFSLYKIIVPAFYACGDTRRPLMVGLGAVALNVVLNVTFILTWPEGYKHAGLACATVISSGVSCLVLAGLLGHHRCSPDWRAVARTCARALPAALAMAWVAFKLHAALLRLPLELNAKLTQLIAVGGAMVGGMAIYGLLAVLLLRSELVSLKR